MPPVTLSDLCLAAGKPLISASVIGRAGYAGGFCGAAPSYRAIFPDLPAQAASCASAAVLGPAVAALGAVQAQMALSVLIGLEPSPLGRIVTLDMASWRFGGFGFADASEAPGFGFVAATQIVATDTLLDLRPAGTVRAIPAAQVVAPGDLADWPIPAGRVVLCCSTYLRAWRGAQVLAARGATLLDAAGCAAMIARLIPRTALVTPNLPEAARLTGLQSGAAMGALASGFFAMGARAVLLKGGHASGAEAVDWLLRPDAAPLRFANLRKPGSRRGTGCTLASAIAIHLARGVDLATACAQAKCYLSAWL